MELVDPLRLLAAVLVVAGLVALFLVVARRLERLRCGAAGGRRLAVLETCWLDGRTRLVLVRCDAAEHLLLIGQTGAQAILAPPPTTEPGR